MIGGVGLHQLLAQPSREVAILDQWKRRWGHGVLRLLGASVHLASAPAAQSVGARLIVANHRSPLDIPALLSLFGGYFLSRGDIADWPLIGRGARKAGTIFVNRSDRHSGGRAIREIRTILRQGRTVSVFPEATTFGGDEVRPFQPGAFAAARGMDVEVVPVGLAYPPGTEFTEDSFIAYAKRIARCPSTPISLCIGESRSMHGSSKETAGQLRDEVQRLVQRAREHHEALAG